jgi:hypothetical protein
MPRPTGRERDLLEVARDRDLLLVSTDPDPNREQEIADYYLCRWLLAGFSGDEKVGFPEPGSKEEWDARAALARYVRGRLKGNIAELLALAIDPRTKSPNPFFKRPTRIFRFDKPRGKPPTALRDFMVVDFIRKQRSSKEDAALRAAEQEFGLGKSRIHAIWATHKKLVDPSKKKRKSIKRKARSTK